MMSTTATPGPTDQQVKSKHRAMWASGDYVAVARDLVAELGPALVAACQVRPGLRVLDVAAGTGNAAIAAAAAGADVVASDLTPELLEIGRRRGAGAGPGAGLGGGRRRDATVRNRRVRRRVVEHRGDVRPAPPARRRRAAAGVPAGRHDRDDQ